MAKDFIVDLDGDGLLDIVRVYNRKKGRKKTKVANVKFGTSKMKRKKKKREKGGKKKSAKKKIKISFTNRWKLKEELIAIPMEGNWWAIETYIEGKLTDRKKIVASKASSVRQRLERIKKQDTTPLTSSEIRFLKHSPYLYAVQLKNKLIVTGKPTFKVKEKLKKSGFKWNSSRGWWEAQASKERIANVKKLGAKVLKI